MLAENKVIEEEEPQMFDEAWNCLNEESHRKWCDAIWKEF